MASIKILTSPSRPENFKIKFVDRFVYCLSFSFLFQILLKNFTYGPKMYFFSPFSFLITTWCSFSKRVLITLDRIFCVNIFYQLILSKVTSYRVFCFKVACWRY
uniref:Uncharacterized protein n=2 Tax=Cacopsylla melanoneura TaxID=428564 RepID=A0A8D8S5B2_9HEMI